MRTCKLAALFFWLILLASCAAGNSSAADPAQEQEAWSSGYESGYQAGYQEGLAAHPLPQEPGSPEEDPVPPAPEPDSSAFVMISDAVPDAILEVRYYSTYNFVGDRIDGYEAPVALLTREAAGALREVSDELAKQGYRLKIYDAYRPQSAVDHFQRWEIGRAHV